MQQPIVELLIRFGIVLQNVILHELFGKIVGFGLLFVQRFLQEFGVGARGGKFLLDAFDHVLPRFIQIVVYFFLLSGEAQHLREIRPVLIDCFARTPHRDRTCASAGCEITSLLRAAGSASTFPEIAIR